MNRFLITSALFLALTSMAKADIIVETKVGGDIASTIETIKKITLNDGVLKVEMKDNSQSSCSLADITKIYFGNPTSVNGIQQKQGSVYALGNKLYVSGLTKDTKIEIYAANGTLVKQAKVKAEEGIISFETLENGVYLIKIGEVSLKIQKR